MDGTEDRNVVVSPYYYVTRQDRGEAQPDETSDDNEDEGVSQDETGREASQAPSPSAAQAVDSEVPAAGPSSATESERKRNPSGATREGEQRQRDMIQTLVGSVVSPCMLLRDLEQREGHFFVFHDLSIRTPGQYRIRFSLLRLMPK